jgi:chromosome segregation ATPase
MDRTYEARKQKAQQEIQQIEAALEKARKKKAAIEKQEDLSEKTAKLQTVQLQLQAQVAEQNALYSKEQERFNAEVAEATKRLRVQHEARMKAIEASHQTAGPKWKDIQFELDTIGSQIRENEKQISVRCDCLPLVGTAG